ncbi:MAG: iron export ABC transporter permease subunit FetB [Proteobacteria bacterium]|nr:MAG: iron export ABC transporter permease subunit FetB [Pseudomonadota bacterium]
MTGAIALDAWDLAAAAALVTVSGAISVALRLGLLRRLVVASARTVAQLILIGYLLSWIFGLDEAPAVMGLMGVMGVVAGHAAVGRSERRFRGALPRAVATLLVTGLVTVFTVTTVIIGVDPWYEPQYVIPLFGMILGNALTGISLCLDTLLESLDARGAEVELALSLGATRWEAARPAIAHAVRRGMIPTINAMTVVGLVSLPGMMTGQILQGAAPIDAVRYQVVVMFMLAAATALGAMAMALLVYRRMFTAGHQLRADRIRR